MPKSLKKQLVKAVFNGDENEVRRLIVIAKKADIFPRFSFSKTPEQIAKSRGHKKIAYLLNGIGNYLREGSNITPEIALKRFDKYVDKQQTLHVLLLNAISKNDISAVEELLKNGANPNIKAKGDKSTPLNIAVFHGKEDIVRLLLSNGANPNMTTKGDESTPLHIAALHGNEDIVRQLITVRKDDIFAENRYQETPEQIAKSRGHEKIADLLNIVGSYLGEDSPITPERALELYDEHMAIQNIDNPPPSPALSEVGGAQTPNMPIAPSI